ncbi:NADP-dependent oxidoreductase [Alicyclobacillus mali]|uniref:NADP-dependent oxidoreductase n=1 Tax=Alicyclobacillus mali (ex Roth et al. 2021) TaxID=1123961 RepID=A0ABS0F200_9BACL|nr:NADP-dependent oxidoreductase [Alicyclobacillus mali (ex Roth et al. 2021)]MBF8377315.1 NADP-dependent oxidoreductase [Alicyclobacillus mali (ex Roth et al. 2021)]
MTVTAKRIVLAQRPQGTPTLDCFRFETVDLPPLEDSQVLVKTLYLSVDPYMRGRMNDVKSYVPPYRLNEPITGGAVCEIVESKAEHLRPGDVVLTQTGWQTHAVVPGAKVQKLQPAPEPLTLALGLLGMTGLTAYFGLIDVCDPKPGETVVVSGAAGAVGMVVGQIAKILGCRAVGIAGSDEKVRFLTEELGFDAAVNYKSPTFAEDLKQACADGIDVYFDNVGGTVSDEVLKRINEFARISLCGQIALYNLDKPDVGPRPGPLLLTRKAKMQGFIVGDYAPRFPEGLQKLQTWFNEGRLKSRETVIEGFDQTIDAFLGLFTGVNTGKLVVKVS